MTIRKAIIYEGNTADGLRRAFVEAYEEAVKANADLLILTPVKDQLRHGILVDVLGESACKVLLKGAYVQTNGGKPRLRHATERTFSSHWETREVVLACWLDKKAMDTVDGTSPPAIVYIAWHPEDGETWARQWGIEGAGVATPPDLVPVVERALHSLTGVVNLSTGLSDPRDKKAAKDTFLALARAGHRMTGDAVRAWALQNGWQPRDARELGELASAIVNGKYAGERVETWRPDILQIWQEEATDE